MLHLHAENIPFECLIPLRCAICLELANEHRIVLLFVRCELEGIEGVNNFLARQMKERGSFSALVHSFHVAFQVYRNVLSKCPPLQQVKISGKGEGGAFPEWHQCSRWQQPSFPARKKKMECMWNSSEAFSLSSMAHTLQRLLTNTRNTMAMRSDRVKHGMEAPPMISHRHSSKQ